METTLNRLSVISRRSWVRAFDVPLETLVRARLAASHWAARWRNARRRAQQHAALRHLSPHLLRDIGAPDEMIADALLGQSARDHYQARSFRGD